jgi:hypothetical protein
MTFRPRAGTRKAIHFVSNPGGLPDCADLADLRVCSAEDSKDDVGTIHRSAQSAFPSAPPSARKHVEGIAARHHPVGVAIDHQNWLKDSDKQSACTNQTLSLRSISGLAVLRRERSRRRRGD